MDLKWKSFGFGHNGRGEAGEASGIVLLFFYSRAFIKRRGFLVTEGYQFELNYFCLYLETVKV